MARKGKKKTGPKTHRRKYSPTQQAKFWGQMEEAASEAGFSAGEKFAERKKEIAEMAAEGMKPGS